MRLEFIIILCMVVLTASLLIIFGCSWRFNKDAPKISKKVYICIFCAAILIVSIPFLINESYISNKGYMTVWEGKDLLAFYGSVLTFVGTVSLGVLALWQNFRFKKANDLKDERYVWMENEKIRLQYLPQFLIQTANPENCIDSRYVLSDNFKDTHIALNRFKTYGFFIRKDTIEWIPNDKWPVIEKGSEDRIFSITNCGNNTAHQVKLSVTIGTKEYTCEKSNSLKKDDEIYFYFGLNNNIDINDKIILSIRYFDSFQNVYMQKFEIVNGKEFVYIISYSEVELIKRSDCMNITNGGKKK